MCLRQRHWLADARLNSRSPDQVYQKIKLNQAAKHCDEPFALLSDCHSQTGITKDAGRSRQSWIPAHENRQTSFTIKATRCHLDPSSHSRR